MIVTALIVIIGVMLTIVYQAFSLLTFVVPDSISYTLNYAWSQAAWLKGWLPLYSNASMSGPAGQFGILDILLSASLIISTFYTFKLLIRILSIIPWFNLGMFNANAIHTTVSKTVRSGSGISTKSINKRG